MDHYLGSRVKVCTEEGVYVGELCDLDSNSGRLTIDKVTIDEKIKLPGQCNLYRKDIQNIQIIEESKKLSKEVVHQGERGQGRIVSRHEAPRHLNKLKDPTTSTFASDPKTKELLLQQTDFGKYLCGYYSDHVTMCLTYLSVPKPEVKPSPRTILKRTEPVSSALPKKPVVDLSNRPTSYTIVDALNTNFRDAVQSLAAENIISIAAEGIRIGRNGTLAWLQMATRQHVMLFDMKALGPRAFEEGIRYLLEEPTILKIIHDCRGLSDLLHHIYKIRLVNIFDTQVADAVIEFNKKGTWPEYTNPLNKCILMFLDVDISEISIFRKHAETYEADQSVWLRRPLPPPALDYLVKSVRCLRELRLVLMERMLSVFTDGVDIYLSVNRDSTDAVASKKEKNQHLLPSEFADLRCQAADSRKKTAQISDSFHSNCDGVFDPNFKYCHDGMWHQGYGLVKPIPERYERKAPRVRFEDDESSCNGLSVEGPGLLTLGAEALKRQEKLNKKTEAIAAAQSPIHTDVIAVQSLKDADVIAVQSPKNADVFAVQSPQNADVIAVQSPNNADVIPAVSSPKEADIISPFLLPPSEEELKPCALDQSFVPAGHFIQNRKKLPMTQTDSCYDTGSDFDSAPKASLTCMSFDAIPTGNSNMSISSPEEEEVPKAEPQMPVYRKGKGRAFVLQSDFSSTPAPSFTGIGRGRGSILNLLARE
ncbi:hypothetical protein CAPTEDRAFT_220187 [Capitella teleta]|uniref:3'-5' exonuclease domain-containing protein n=1 Tax=Capitella teleta TaxID=283909 RepID=R7VH01_CAPTE|nr:hypothetical protein CAPTEDRAFT_220187 [Capitella teleta]|eukprot:ELU15581.1 hypothetical protein CAPTEDRAFT_220187 [Capitella teleta]